MSAAPILALNSGSSSLKFALFAPPTAPSGDVCLLHRGAIEGIGSRESRFWIRSAQSSSAPPETDDRKSTISTHSEAIRALAEKFSKLSPATPAAIGHRIVHGGPRLLEHCRITPQVFSQLEAAAPFAPLHVPVALALIRAAEQHFPGVPEFACLDTAFHRTLPEAAARLPLPETFWNAGIRRYGFHGLSCESVLRALGHEARPRLIVAHLGNGASITAIANRASVDTTMGLTPTGGILMSTRTGDLDPGAILHLLRNWSQNAAQLEQLLDNQSGLLGVSGISGDMRELHHAMDKAGARLAVRMYCLSAKKAIAGFIAVLGGIDQLVFTGGIGEHDAVVRDGICEGLQPFGIAIERRANARHLPLISPAAAPVQIRIVPAGEEAEIARHCLSLLRDR
jgi:acetate kinase